MSKIKEIMLLADMIKEEIYRMCVTHDLSELDTMALHAKKNIEKLQNMRYSDLAEEVREEQAKIEQLEHDILYEPTFSEEEESEEEMIKEPLFMSVPTIGDFEQYKDGWNDAMRYIFGQEIHATELKASCWVVKNYGEKICTNCQNREVCGLAMDESVLDYIKEL